MHPDLAQRDWLDRAELIHSPEVIQTALHRVADQLNARFAGQYPLVFSVMGGAVVFTGQLLPLLMFPLEFDYLHVSRYGDARRGGKLHWKVAPAENVAGRVVLVLDDILDEGHTLAAIRERVMALGAAQFYSAVFAEKKLPHKKPICADFVALDVPDRFVFGYGMDIQGVWRNLPAIYALKEK